MSSALRAFITRDFSLDEDVDWGFVAQMNQSQLRRMVVSGKPTPAPGSESGPAEAAITAAEDTDSACKGGHALDEEKRAQLVFDSFFSFRNRSLVPMIVALFTAISSQFVLMAILGSQLSAFTLSVGTFLHIALAVVAILDYVIGGRPHLLRYGQTNRNWLLFWWQAITAVVVGYSFGAYCPLTGVQKEVRHQCFKIVNFGVVTGVMVPPLIYKIFPKFTGMIALITVVILYLFRFAATPMLTMDEIGDTPEELVLQLCTYLIIIAISIQFSSHQLGRDVEAFHQRVRAHVSIKASHDTQQELLSMLNAVMAPSIIQKVIRRKSDKRSASYSDSTDCAAVLFSDIANFTSWCASRDSADVTKMLHLVVGEFDVLCKRGGICKVKTIGDGYWCVCGLPKTEKHNANDSKTLTSTFNSLQLCSAAISMHKIVTDLAAEHPEWKTPEQQSSGGSKASPIRLRIGIHCGPLSGWLTGTKALSYEVYGETSNIAQELEKRCPVGDVCISSKVAANVNESFGRELLSMNEASGALVVEGKEGGVQQLDYFFMNLSEKRALDTPLLLNTSGSAQPSPSVTPTHASMNSTNLAVEGHSKTKSALMELSEHIQLFDLEETEEINDWNLIGRGNHSSGGSFGHSHSSVTSSHTWDSSSPRQELRKLSLSQSSAHESESLHSMQSTKVHDALLLFLSQRGMTLLGEEAEPAVSNEPPAAELAKIEEERQSTTAASVDVTPATVLASEVTDTWEDAFLHTYEKYKVQHRKMSMALVVFCGWIIFAENLPPSQVGELRPATVILLIVSLVGFVGACLLLHYVAWKEKMNEVIPLIHAPEDSATAPHSGLITTARLRLLMKVVCSIHYFSQWLMFLASWIQFHKFNTGISGLHWHVLRICFGWQIAVTSLHCFESSFHIFMSGVHCLLSIALMLATDHWVASESQRTGILGSTLWLFFLFAFVCQHDSNLGKAERIEYVLSQRMVEQAHSVSKAQQLMLASVIPSFAVPQLLNWIRVRKTVPQSLLPPTFQCFNACITFGSFVVPRQPELQSTAAHQGENRAQAPWQVSMQLLLDEKLELASQTHNLVKIKTIGDIFILAGPFVLSQVEESTRSLGVSASYPSKKNKERRHVLASSKAFAKKQEYENRVLQSTPSVEQLAESAQALLRLLSLLVRAPQLSSSTRSPDSSKPPSSSGFDLLVGVHHGPISAAIIGTSNLTLDVFGDTVNTAARIQGSLANEKISSHSSSNGSVHTGCNRLFARLSASFVDQCLRGMPASNAVAIRFSATWPPLSPKEKVEESVTQVESVQVEAIVQNQPQDIFAKGKGTIAVHSLQVH